MMDSERFSPEFLRAWDYLFENEKGYVNDSIDPGGPTKYGITIMTLSTWRITQATAQDVENLTIEEAQEIYHAWFWELLSCNRMPWAPAICIFDSGVLYGTLIAAKLAQETANNHGAELRVDGILGPVSAAAIAAIDVRTFIVGYYECLKARIDAVILARPASAKYRNGWSVRAKRLLSLIEEPPKSEQEKKA